MDNAWYWNDQSSDNHGSTVEEFYICWESNFVLNSEKYFHGTVIFSIPPKYTYILIGFGKLFNC